MIYRKGAIHRTEIKRPFLAAKGFNTNLVIHFLVLYHAIISSVYVCLFTGMISHVHGGAPKTVWHAQNLVCEKL